jgi:bacterioferritin (cytochrome b1)
MGHHGLITLTADEILHGLNRALVAERQAVADYQAHAQASDRADVREALETLGDVEREHALRLSLRITALGGTPTSEAPEPQPAGDTLASWLARDLEGEQWAIVEYARLVAGTVGDDATAELMTELLLDEIRHAAWLKSTLGALAAGG